MFKKIGEMESNHQIIFSILIGLAVISFWRGIWGLLEVYLFPNDLLLSLWVSVGIGIFILIVTQYTAKELM